MSKKLLKAPPGVTHAQVGGKDYEVDEDGMIEVENADHITELTHPTLGFTDAGDAPEAKIAERPPFERMTKSVLWDYLQEQKYEGALTAESLQKELAAAAIETYDRTRSEPGAGAA